MKRAIIRHTSDYLEYVKIVNSEYVNWRPKASCLGILSEQADFYDVREHYLKGLAKRYCNQCDARKECLYSALVTQEEYGLWGGLTPKQRKAITVQIAKDATEANIDYNYWSPELNEIYKYYSGFEQDFDLTEEED